MPVDTRGVQRGNSGPPHPSGILGQATDGSLYGRVLGAAFKGFRGETQVDPLPPHHF